MFYPESLDLVLTIFPLMNFMQSWVWVLILCKYTFILITEEHNNWSRIAYFAIHCKRKGYCMMKKSPVESVNTHNFIYYKNLFRTTFTISCAINLKCPSWHLKVLVQTRHNNWTRRQTDRQDNAYIHTLMLIMLA